MLMKLWVGFHCYSTIINFTVQITKLLPSSRTCLKWNKKRDQKTIRLQYLVCKGVTEHFIIVYLRLDSLLGDISLTGAAAAEDLWTQNYSYKLSFIKNGLIKALEISNTFMTIEQRVSFNKLIELYNISPIIF